MPMIDDDDDDDDDDVKPLIIPCNVTNATINVIATSRLLLFDKRATPESSQQISK